MPDKRKILYKIAPFVEGEKVVDAENVEVDDSSLSEVTATDSQAVANELERLYGIVRAIQNSAVTQPRPLNTFDSSVTIVPGNVGDFINRNSLYVRSDNARVNFVLPAESTILGQYPALFEISHFGGTSRIDGGFNPDNTIRITRPVDYDANDPSTFLRRSSETGANLQFSELHLGDTAIITKQDADSPWVVIESSADPRTSILTNGVFQFNTRGVTFPTGASGDHFIGGLSLYTPTQGDAFEVIGSGITEESTFGRAIDTGDVIVAKIDSPSLLLDENNDDWLIIRDAGHGELTLRELRFLAQIQESDTFTDSRLVDRGDVNSVRAWLATGALDHAPFITPSGDPDNPQGDGVSYLGGDEDRGANNEFEYSVPVGNRLPNRLLYVDIDEGSFVINDNINNIFVVHKDRDGTEISRHNLSTEFRAITLTGSSDTYYVFDDVAAADNFSTINYVDGQTLEVVIRATNRRFELGEAVDIIDSIRSGTINIDKLSSTLQSIILSDHSLTADQIAKLTGLTLNVDSSAIPNNHTFYAKLIDSSTTNDLSHYHSIEQQNGLLPDYERTISYFILVDPSISVTGLQKTDNTAVKLSITSRGTISTTDGQRWQAFTFTLPAITGANSVLDNAWQIDGNVNTSTLSGAESTFKVGLNNLGQDVLDRLNHEITPPGLPDILQQWSNDLTRTVRTITGWRELPSPIRTDLARQYACLWTENIHSGVVNSFDDITGVEFIGTADNTRFYYADPNDQYNTSFPGAQAYVLSDNVRVRNLSGGSNPITDSFRKIIGFDYALQRALDSGSNEDMVRVGSSSTTALMGLSEEEGLYLNIGRQDGGQRSRTYDEPLTVAGGHWHDQVDETEATEAEVVLPQSNTGSLIVRIDIQLDNNGNDDGTHEETITITNLESDQDFGDRDFTFTVLGVPMTRTVAISYEHDNNDLPTSRRVIFLRPTQPFTNAAFTYNVAAHIIVTETWNVANTYARYPINAGNSHDDFGLFDPHNWNTEHVRERNRVLFLLQKYRESDDDTDPEMAVKVVVDGEREGDASKSYVIRLHRPASDFTPDDINFGNSLCGISHIQCYDYDPGTNGALVPSESEMLTLYNSAHIWLGAFTNASEQTDTFEVNGLMQFTGFIGGTEVTITAIEDAGAADGYRWKFTV